ncbi:MAG: hypothetical protein ACRERE_29535 [Candidatus Entotheonellia bacterium]
MERLAEAREHQVPWKQWGAYLSERQWGTVREDYSEALVMSLSRREESVSRVPNPKRG